MKNVIIAAALVLSLSSCGDNDVAETQQDLVIRGFPAFHNSALIPNSDTVWHPINGGASHGEFATPMIIRWGAGVITIDYTGETGSFADRCTLPYETLSYIGQPIPGAYNGAQNYARNTGGTCTWQGVVRQVHAADLFIYQGAAGGYIVTGYDLVNKNALWLVSLNDPDFENGHFN